TQAKTELSPEILLYYLACSQDVPNPFQQRLTMSQRALSSIHSQLHGLEREAIPQFPAAERNLVSVQGTLNTTESNFHQLVALLNCRGLHKVSAPAPPGGVPLLGPPLAGFPPAMVAPLGCGSFPRGCSSCCSSPSSRPSPSPRLSAACPAPGRGSTAGGWGKAQGAGPLRGWSRAGSRGWGGAGYRGWDIWGGGAGLFVVGGATHIAGWGV
uniref:Protein tweety homolog n=1 Tax=Terrapene triunguis TaxID=2587831 RepID=A0A674J8K6_9SAUR